MLTLIGYEIILWFNVTNHGSHYQNFFSPGQRNIPLIIGFGGVLGSALESLLPKLGAISKTKFRSIGWWAVSIETFDFDFGFCFSLLSSPCSTSQSKTSNSLSLVGVLSFSLLCCLPCCLYCFHHVFLLWCWAAFLLVWLVVVVFGVVGYEGLWFLCGCFLVDAEYLSISSFSFFNFLPVSLLPLLFFQLLPSISITSCMGAVAHSSSLYLLFAKRIVQQVVAFSIV